MSTKRVCSITLLFLLLSHFAFAQYTDRDQKLIKYYAEGTKALQDGNYLLADSLLTKSLDFGERFDNMYNLAVAKLFQADTASCCNILRRTEFEREQDAKDLYYPMCGRADTVYMDKKFADRLDRDTISGQYVIYQKANYSDTTLVIFRDESKKSKEKEMQLFGKQTDVLEIVGIAVILKQIDTVFIHIRNGHTIDPNFKKKLEGNIYRREAQLRFGFHKAILPINLIIDEEGNAKKVFYPDLKLGEKEQKEFVILMDKMIASLSPLPITQFYGHNVSALRSFVLYYYIKGLK